jgi:hypothetical protein
MVKGWTLDVLTDKKPGCYVGGFTWKPDLIADSHMRVYP